VLIVRQPDAPGEHGQEEGLSNSNPAENKDEKSKEVAKLPKSTMV